ncbi:hypothetical protein B0H16DRAFT_1472451 [Mycena metata]|uniref:Uncharacterized protein n=1 Tax=Mycena metata TaxID=1033252 RepID=A0AAD7HMZ3_9AGAR|nr:hypothetical protein B0H16DRAFT_1472451 [Mycena metata]
MIALASKGYVPREKGTLIKPLKGPKGLTKNFTLNKALIRNTGPKYASVLSKHAKRERKALGLPWCIVLILCVAEVLDVPVKHVRAVQLEGMMEAKAEIIIVRPFSADVTTRAEDPPVQGVMSVDSQGRKKRGLLFAARDSAQPSTMTTKSAIELRTKSQEDGHWLIIFF